ncbi:3-dehydroquinate synthase [Fusibacter sp. 3D3]|uniref:3-dehydroquinate synthase n=1 Tax=Fusibacter sp. 3D3 TaxID=1048380 RepID=UPI000853BFD8|nr:3-dehydroquinate synthase [Fusibacter sp. 3D3]GAU78163.1 3-dehydroquinate synthase [Fusibacter sp. 3D3]
MARSITVTTPQSEYDIIIDAGWIDAQKINEIIQNRKYLIVTDENVYSHYGDLLKSFECLVLPVGEGTKSLKYFEKVIDLLQDKQFNRSSVLIAFGGGVIGDLTGYVAASYMRGIHFVQIPTTLLAMVDSSVGGKVAINHTSAKNLIGAFYQPEAVYMDVNFLKTLTQKVLSDGMAEVIKYGLGFDPKLFSKLEALNLDKLSSPEHQEAVLDIVETCCRIKAQIVHEDERDVAVRQLLNLGHTIGHAIEQFYQYKKYTHGQAIAIGMVVKSRIAFFEKRIDQQAIERIEKLFEQYHLPLELEEPKMFSTLLEAIHLDKKSTGAHIKWICVDAIGKCRIEGVQFEEIAQKIKNMNRECDL